MRMSFGSLTDYASGNSFLREWSVRIDSSDYSSVETNMFAVMHGAELNAEPAKSAENKAFSFAFSAPSAFQLRRPFRRARAAQPLFPSAVSEKGREYYSVP